VVKKKRGSSTKKGGERANALKGKRWIDLVLITYFNEKKKKKKREDTRGGVSNNHHGGEKSDLCGDKDLWRQGRSSFLMREKLWKVGPNRVDEGGGEGYLYLEMGKGGNVTRRLAAIDLRCRFQELLQQKERGPLCTEERKGNRGRSL